MAVLELNFVQQLFRQGFSLVKKHALTLEAEEDLGRESPHLVVAGFELFYQPPGCDEEDLRLVGVAFWFQSHRPGRIDVVVETKHFPRGL